MTGTNQLVRRIRRFGKAVSFNFLLQPLSVLAGQRGLSALLMQGIDDPEIYDGAHVGLQIVARRLQEEKVLALTEILSDALGNHIV